VYNYRTIRKTLEESEPIDDGGKFSRGVTKTGTNPTKKRTVAVNPVQGSPCCINYDTEMYIDFGRGNEWNGVYKAEDTGSAFRGECKIDVYGGVGLEELEESRSQVDSSPRIWLLDDDGYCGPGGGNFRGERGDGFGGDMAIDEFSLVEAPTCPQPSDIAVSNVTDTTADVSWNAALSSQDTFDLEVVPAGSEPTGVPSIENVTENPYTITDLNSETDYDVYVRADCGGGDESFWIGPASFTTVLTPIIVTESNPSTDNVYCYGNSDFKEWLFIKDEDSDEDLKITFNSGVLEEDPLSSDQLLCYDGFDESAPLLYDSQVDGDDPSGLTITAPSGVIYMTLTSDIFGSCQGGTEDLEPLDFDVYLGTLGAEEFDKNNFEFYPNPVDDRLILQAQSNIEKLSLFNMIGQKVKEFNSINNTSFEAPMSDLQAGTYLMKVKIEGVSNTFRVIKK
jgi:3D (Asp-Asp-Asp) domain-containing protein